MKTTDQFFREINTDPIMKKFTRDCEKQFKEYESGHGKVIAFLIWENVQLVDEINLYRALLGLEPMDDLQ